MADNSARAGLMNGRPILNLTALSSNLTNVVTHRRRSLWEIRYRWALLLSLKESKIVEYSSMVISELSDEAAKGTIIRGLERHVSGDKGLAEKPSNSLQMRQISIIFDQKFVPQVHGH
jgi:hypothetical protein